MNERTKAWIKEVGEDCYEYSKMAQDVWFNKEKFAKLIVKECMEQVWYTREDYINENISEVIKERMKQHFGVEE